MKDIDPATASRAEMEEAYADLRRSRDDIKANHNAQAKRIRAVEDTMARLMPEASLMVTALAERAGLGHSSEIQAMAEALGNASYSHWSETPQDPPKLPEFLDPEEDPRAGDAEMILTARIHNAIGDLDRITLTRMDRAHAERVRELIGAVEEGFDAALADFRPAPPRPAAPETAEAAIPAAIHPSVRDVFHELVDILEDTAMCSACLRRDLRAAMYRSALDRIAATAGKLQARLDAAKTPATADSQPADDLPF